MLSSPRFGIISGAGPMAGALLYELVIEQLQQTGAWQDADFPNILIQNIPFSDMLSGTIENPVVRNELLEGVTFLSQHCDYVYIACQTLHAFLTPEDIKRYKIVSLLDLIKQQVMDENQALSVIASKTSRYFDLHSKGIGRTCSYIFTNQAEQAIDDILKGQAVDLSEIEALAEFQPIILGCTEFSIPLRHSQAPYLIDPLKLAAHDIVLKFNNTSQALRDKPKR